MLVLNVRLCPASLQRTPLVIKSRRFREPASPLGIVDILSRPDRIFAGMVFKELELRGLPEKRTIEIEGEGIKLIIEPVRARKITSS